MQLKTSTALSLKITVYVLTLLLLLGVMVNALFFFQRRNTEQRKLTQPMPVRFFQPKDRSVREKKQSNIIAVKMPLQHNMTVIEFTDEVYQHLKEEVLI